MGQPLKQSALQDMVVIVYVGHAPLYCVYSARFQTECRIYKNSVMYIQREGEREKEREREREREDGMYIKFVTRKGARRYAYCQICHVVP